MSNNATNPVRGVEHTLTILETLKALDGARLSELADRLDLSKSTIHNHLATLRQHHYVVKETNTYYVGLRWFGLGGFARDQVDVYHLARPTVDDLATETSELALVTTEVHGYSMYLYQSSGDRAVTTDSYPGIELPLHCTATGKAMLAHLPDERREYLLDKHGLQQQTNHSITEQQSLREELQRIRDQGFALDDEERIDGMRGVAVPITREDTGELLGALSITGPTHRIKGDRFKTELPDMIHQSAREIEINATYR